MSVDISSLVLAVDSRQVATAERNISRFDRTGRRAETATQNLQRSLDGVRLAFAGLGIGLLTRQLMQSIEAWQRLEKAIKLSTEATGDFRGVFDGLYASAQRAGTAMVDAVAIFRGVNRAAPALKATMEEVLATSEAVQHLVAAGGQTKSAAQGAMQQFSQMLSNPVVQMQEFNSLLDGAPLLAEAIAKGLSMTTAELRTIIMAGGFLSKNVFASLIGQADMINKKFGALEKDIAQSWDILGNTFSKTASNVDRVLNLTYSIAESIRDVAKAFEGIDDANIKSTANALQTLAEVAAGYLVFVKIIPALKTAGLSGWAATTTAIERQRISYGRITHAEHAYQLAHAEMAAARIQSELAVMDATVVAHRSMAAAASLEASVATASAAAAVRAIVVATEARNVAASSAVASATTIAEAEARVTAARNLGIVAHNRSVLATNASVIASGQLTNSINAQMAAMERLAIANQAVATTAATATATAITATGVFAAMSSAIRGVGAAVFSLNGLFNIWIGYSIGKWAIEEFQVVKIGVFATSAVFRETWEGIKLFFTTTLKSMTAAWEHYFAYVKVAWGHVAEFVGKTMANIPTEGLKKRGMKLQAWGVELQGSHEKAKKSVLELANAVDKAKIAHDDNVESIRENTVALINFELHGDAATKQILKQIAARKALVEPQLRTEGALKASKAQEKRTKEIQKEILELSNLRAEIGKNDDQLMQLEVDRVNAEIAKARSAKHSQDMAKEAAIVSQKKIADITSEIKAINKAKISMKEQTPIIKKIAEKTAEIAALRKKSSAVSAAIDKSAIPVLQKHIDLLVIKRNAMVANNNATAMADIKEQIEDMKEQNSRIGLTTEAIEAQTIAKRINAIESVKGRKIGKEEIEQRKILVNLIREGASKRAAEQAKKIGETIESSLTDAFMSAFDSGKSFAEEFANSLKSMFKSLILRPTIQYIMSGGTAGALLGSPGMAGASPGGVGGMGVGGWFNAGKSAYDAFTGGMSEAYMSMATSGVGQALGLGKAGTAGLLPSGMSTTLKGVSAAGTGGLAGTSGGLTSAGTALQTGLGYAGAGMAGIAIGSTIAGDKEIFGVNGTITSAVGAAIGSALGPPVALLGGIVGGIVGGLFSAAFGMGPKESGTTTLRGTATAEGVAGRYETPWKKRGGWWVSDKRGTDYQSMATEQEKAFSNLIIGTQSVFDELSKSADESTRSLDGWSFAFNRNLQTEAAQNQLMVDIADSMGSHLIPSLKDFQREGENLADTAVRMSDTFKITSRLATLLGHESAVAFGKIGLAGGEMRARLLEAMGGIQESTGKIQNYYQEFFSASERRANDLRELTNAMTSLGIEVIPSTRDGFRSLVESQDLATKSGQNLFAGLINLSPAFASVFEYVDAGAQSMSRFTESLAKFRDSLGVSEDFITSIGERYEDAQRKFNLTSKAAALGDVSALEKLQGVVTSFISASKESSATSLDLARDMARVYQSLDAAISTTERQSIPQLANGGSHAGGLRIVGEKGPELELTGPSRIIPNHELQRGSNADLITEIVALRAEVKTLREENMAGQVQIAKNTGNTAKTLDKFDRDGLPEEREAA